MNRNEYLQEAHELMGTNNAKLDGEAATGALFALAAENQRLRAAIVWLLEHLDNAEIQDWPDPQRPGTGWREAHLRVGGVEIRRRLREALGEAVRKAVEG